jgi:hypothetical protein
MESSGILKSLSRKPLKNSTGYAKIQERNDCRAVIGSDGLVILNRRKEYIGKHCKIRADSGSNIMETVK